MPILASIDGRDPLTATVTVLVDGKEKGDVQARLLPINPEAGVINLTAAPSYVRSRLVGREETIRSALNLALEEAGEEGRFTTLTIVTEER